MVTAKEAEHILREVKGNSSFRLHMGADIKSLKELAEALDIMADKAFSHHITESRNDFSVWVRDVLGDEELARKIAQMKNKAAIRFAIIRRIEEHENKMAETHVTTTELLNMGAVDFLIGMIIGFVGGIIVAMVI